MDIELYVFLTFLYHFQLEVSPDELETLEMELDAVLTDPVDPPAEVIHADGARRQAEKDQRGVRSIQSLRVPILIPVGGHLFHV